MFLADVPPLSDRRPRVHGGRFRAAATETAGADLEEYFANYVHGTKPLPWDDLLQVAGLRLIARDSTSKSWIGLTTRETGEKVVVARVLDGSPARRAGLDGGDEIVAVEGRKATGRELDKAVAAKKKGETMTFTAFRDNALREFKVVVGDAPVPEYALEKIADPTPAQKEVYEQWLLTSWE